MKRILLVLVMFTLVLTIAGCTDEPNVKDNDILECAEGQSIEGGVCVDDVVDVIREEATEDFLQMAGAGKDREILLKSSWENAKARLPWLFASWVGGVIAASLIGVFENMLENIIALAAFIPVIIGMLAQLGITQINKWLDGQNNLNNTASQLFFDDCNKVSIVFAFRSKRSKYKRSIQ